MSSRKADGPARRERAVGRWNARRSPRRAGQTSIQRDGKGEWEMAKRWICLWAALVLALMGVCLGVAVWDGVAWARTGEFQLLPALNVTRFRSDGSLDEEDAQALTGASAFFDELYETGHDERDPLWKFVNVSTWLALLDLPFFYCGSWRAPAARGEGRARAFRRHRPAAHRRRAFLRAGLLWRLHHRDMLFRRLYRAARSVSSHRRPAGADAHCQAVPGEMRPAAPGSPPVLSYCFYLTERPSDGKIKWFGCWKKAKGGKAPCWSWKS